MFKLLKWILVHLFRSNKSGFVLAWLIWQMLEIVVVIIGLFGLLAWYICTIV